MIRCCMPNGFVHPDKVELLARIEAEGVALPNDARIWGPGSGWAWRLVDHAGRDLGVRGRQSVRAAAAPGTRLVIRDGEARAVPVASPRAVPG